MNNNNIAQLRQMILSGVVSSKEITLDILRKVQQSDLNCFISFLDALSFAREVDKKIRGGFEGALAGVPVAIKDNMRFKGSVTTCGSALLKDASPDTDDCAVVKRLKDAGAVIIGKTNMDEFAMGSSNTTSAFGRVLNPIDKTRVPGGSSGGSAAAVRAGLCYAALGSDTGGSIRQPASYCGVVGLKPTFGSVDGSGMYALSQDMDQVGPITRTVDDNKLMFEVLTGRKIELPEARGLRIGLIKEFEAYYSHDVKRVVDRAKSVLDDCEFVELSAPSIGLSYYVYSVLGNVQSANNIRPLGSAQSRFRLGKEVKKRILIGEYAISHPHIVESATEIKSRIVAELNKALSSCDVILSPTAPSVAFEFTADRSGREIVFSDIFTQPASIAGLPALSVPCIETNGLPIGVQLFGAKNSEGLLFALGKRFE